MAYCLRLLVTLYFAFTLCDGAVTLDTPTTNGSSARGSLVESGLTRTLRHIYAICGDRDDLFWCVKLQATRLLGRALKVHNINIVDGVTIVKRLDNETRTGRASPSAELSLSNRDLEQLSMKSLDALLLERFVRFVQSRQLQVNLPRLSSAGQRNGHDLLGAVMEFFTQFTGSEHGGDGEEGRKKKGDDKKYLGPFIAAVMLKAAILKMAYHSIAIVAGKALIVGKIALIISAIIGLKKLVSAEGGEKTTYEIVKHPQVQQTHTYSSSHAGEYESGHESGGGGGGGGSYHRSIDDEMMMQDKAYNAWVPTRVQS